MIKKKNLRYLEVPSYKELFVNNIWRFVQDVSDLIKFFPTYNANQLPDRDYMLCILATLRYNQLNNMVHNARKNRSLNTQDSDNDLIHISKKLYEEISGVFTQKRKYYQRSTFNSYEV